MKRVFAFILLLSHINTSMFFPQEQESDVYDANGQQVDDINSIVELINVELGLDKTADDEDDDSGQHFHLVKNPDYNFQQQYVLIERTYTEKSEKNTFPIYQVPAMQSVSYDILTPPPEVL